MSLSLFSICWIFLYPRLYLTLKLIIVYALFCVQFTGILLRVFAPLFIIFIDLWFPPFINLSIDNFIYVYNILVTHYSLYPLPTPSLNSSPTFMPCLCVATWTTGFNQSHCYNCDASHWNLSNPSVTASLKAMTTSFLTALCWPYVPLGKVTRELLPIHGRNHSCLSSECHRLVMPARWHFTAFLPIIQFLNSSNPFLMFPEPWKGRSECLVSGCTLHSYSTLRALAGHESQHQPLVTTKIPLWRRLRTLLPRPLDNELL